MTYVFYFYILVNTFPFLGNGLVQSFTYIFSFWPLLTVTNELCMLFNFPTIVVHE